MGDHSGGKRGAGFILCSVFLTSPVWGFMHLYCVLQEILDLPESTYELCYNAACALIGQGTLTEAFNKLQQAEGRCWLGVSSVVLN